MKISGVPSGPYWPSRRATAEDAEPAAAAPADQAAFLGVPEAELTPQVRSAIAQLALEVEDLRSEVRRLRARLAEAEAAADADPLTGVRNRRSFLRELKRIAAFVQRYEAPASVIYFDLDDLKAVNDRHGHAAGDAVLRAVAERLSAHVRETDVVGRIGGDEFAVVLAQTDLATATGKADALARVLSGAPVEIGGGDATVAASWGVSEIDPSLDAEALLAAADAAMFAMKRSR